MPDCGIIIGENSNGPIDRTVDVIRIDDLAGKPLAVVMSAACHTVVLGPKTLSYSPDFIGPARELIEPAIGGPSLFLQGAADNINPACGIGSGGPEQFEDMQRLGLMLGGETLKVWAQIRTHNQRGPRRIVRSVAAISTWDYEPTPQATINHLSVTRRRLNLPLAPLPDLATAESDLARTRAARDAALAGDSLGAKHVAQRMFAWAEQRHRLVSAGNRIVTREIELWAMRINDIGIATVSAEPLAELGLEIKRRSPLPHTMFLGYSNGCIGYIPPPEAFAEEGMKVVAGGMPGGAVAGRESVMRVFDITGDPQHDRHRRVVHFGTFNASPTAAAAGIVVLRRVADGTAIAQADAAALRLRAAWDAVLERQGVAGYVYGPASTYHVYFETDLDRVRQAGARRDLHTTDATRLKGMPSRLIAQSQLRMRFGGVDNMSSTGGLTCAAHTPDEIDRATAVFEKTVIALRDEKLIFSLK